MVYKKSKYGLTYSRKRRVKKSSSLYRKIRRKKVKAKRRNFSKKVKRVIERSLELKRIWYPGYNVDEFSGFVEPLTPYAGDGKNTVTWGPVLSNDAEQYQASCIGAQSAISLSDWLISDMSNVGCGIPMAITQGIESFQRIGKKIKVHKYTVTIKLTLQGQNLQFYQGTPLVAQMGQDIAADKLTMANPNCYDQEFPQYSTVGCQAFHPVTGQIGTQGATFINNMQTFVNNAPLNYWGNGSRVTMDWDPWNIRPGQDRHFSPPRFTDNQQVYSSLPVTIEDGSGGGGASYTMTLPTGYFKQLAQPQFYHNDKGVHTYVFNLIRKPTVWRYENDDDVYPSNWARDIVIYNMSEQIFKISVKQYISFTDA